MSYEQPFWSSSHPHGGAARSASGATLTYEQPFWSSSHPHGGAARSASGVQ